MNKTVFEWHDVTKKRPPRTGVYLVCAYGVRNDITKSRPCVALWDKGYWFLDNPGFFPNKILVTHWSFIPNPNESEGTGDQE